MISKTIHQIWIGSSIPPEIAERMEGIKRGNRNFVYKLHTDLSEFSNDPYIRWAVDSKQPLAFIVDRIRLLCLQRDGGIYVDSDCLHCRSFDYLDVWGDVNADFVFGMRSPDRYGVALRGGISLVDNTVMASALNGRMVSRLLELYHPNSKHQDGGSIGLQILRHMDIDTRVVNFRYFYAEQRCPESIVLHDSINLGSWCKK
jgi:hypothetical protein